MEKRRQLHETATLMSGKQILVVIQLTKMGPTHCTKTSLTNQMTLFFFFFSHHSSSTHLCHTVHLDINKVLLTTDAQDNCFNRSIKIYIKTTPCFDIITIIKERWCMSATLCAADIHQQGPDNICSHTTRLTTPIYFY